MANDESGGDTTTAEKRNDDKDDKDDSRPQGRLASIKHLVLEPYDLEKGTIVMLSCDGAVDFATPARLP